MYRPPVETGQVIGEPSEVDPAGETAGPRLTPRLAMTALSLLNQSGEERKVGGKLMAAPSEARPVQASSRPREARPSWYRRDLQRCFLRKRVANRPGKMAVRLGDDPKLPANASVEIARCALGVENVLMGDVKSPSQPAGRVK